MWMYPSLPTIEGPRKEEEDLDLMPYKETCSLCKGNGYITIVVEGKDEIKQCWLCESKGEKEYSQVEVCLLYTSPSPRDGLLSRMPSSA